MSRIPRRRRGGRLAVQAMLSFASAASAALAMCLLPLPPASAAEPASWGALELPVQRGNGPLPLLIDLTGVFAGRDPPVGAGRTPYAVATISQEGIAVEFSVAGFAKMMEVVESRVLQAIDDAVAKHGVDPHRVFVTGYSVGGDLAWAIAMRNPARIGGALTFSSRDSMRQAKSMSILASSGARFAFTIGTQDQAPRQVGVANAVKDLRANRIPVLLCEIPELGHAVPEPGVVEQALAFLLATEPVTRADPPCRMP